MNNLTKPNKPSKTIKILKSVGKGSAAVGAFSILGGIPVVGIPTLVAGSAAYLIGERIEGKYESKLKEYNEYVNSLGKYR